MGVVISSMQVLSRVDGEVLPSVWLSDVNETVLSTCRQNIELPCSEYDG